MFQNKKDLRLHKHFNSLMWVYPASFLELQSFVIKKEREEGIERERERERKRERETEKERKKEKEG